MANKLTQKIAFTKLVDVVEASQMSKADKDLYVKFLNGRLEALAKKANSAKGGQTATQKENEVLKEKILAEMDSGSKYTVTDMLKSFECVADLSNQKVSALMKQLVESGMVEKTVDKRKSYFSLV